MTTRPTDNLVRAWAGPQATSVRAADDSDGSTMFGHFAVFDTWTEIDSWYEGRFLERIAPGAFDQTFKDRGDQIRVLYDHGADPQIGNKPLGVPTTLREDKVGAYAEVDLFDASYVNDLKPAMRAGQLGQSFRFRVTGEEVVTPSEATEHNPGKLDERTITSVELYEFGPVTFPAYPDGTTPKLRSRTDEFIDRFLTDPAFVARFRERVGPAVVNQIRASLPPTAEEADADVPPTADAASDEESADGDPESTPETSADGAERDATLSEAERRLARWKNATATFDAHIARLKETAS